MSVAHAGARTQRRDPRTVVVVASQGHRPVPRPARAAADRFGRPQRRLPPVVHVGRHQRQRLGLRLSARRALPWRRTGSRLQLAASRAVHERIRLAGDLIDEGALSDLLSDCERANGDAPITFFEITTAAALLAFSWIEADWLVLEVGLGGRLDATNVIDQPAATAITPVSLDHQQFSATRCRDRRGEGRHHEVGRALRGRRPG